MITGAKGQGSTSLTIRLSEPRPSVYTIPHGADDPCDGSSILCAEDTYGQLTPWALGVRPRPSEPGEGTHPEGEEPDALSSHSLLPLDRIVADRGAL